MDKNCGTTSSEMNWDNLYDDTTVVVTPESLIQNNVISRADSWDEIESCLRLASDVLGKLYTLLDERPTTSAISSAVQRFKDTEYARVLKATPVKQLNKHHLGIRVSNLEAAGFHNVFQIKDMVAQQFLAIPGIGRVSAMRITDSLQEVCREARKSIVVDPHKNRNSEMSAIVLECYKFSLESKLFSCATHGLSTYRSTLRALNDEVKQAKSKLQWTVFFSKNKRAQIYRAALKLKSYLSQEMISTIEKALEQKESIQKTPAAKAWIDFDLIPAEYCKCIESRTPVVVDSAPFQYLSQVTLPEIPADCDLVTPIEAKSSRGAAEPAAASSDVSGPVQDYSGSDEDLSLEAIHNDAARKRMIGASIIFATVIAVVVFAFALFGYAVKANRLQYRSIRQMQNIMKHQISTSAGTFVGETDFGYFDGQGVFTFFSGTQYDGEFDANEFNGIGVLNIPQEGSYEGDFAQSMKNGQGEFSWEDGDCYVGEWKDDQLDGQGTYTTADGITYEGQFQENAFWDGICTFENSTGEYAITYKDGCIDQAEISFANGATYVGDCTMDGISGSGMLTYPDGDIYDGDFLEDARNGSGTYTWATGDSYNGEWDKDNMSGDGTYSYASGSTATGTFKNNRFTDGTYTVDTEFGSYSFTIEDSDPVAVSMTLSDGSTYEGGMKDGKLTGTASIHYSNGDTYSGDVEDGEKHGSGSYTWASGASYDGRWSDDLMNGTGTYYYSASESGYKLSGSFADGVPDGTCQYYTSSSKHYKTDWEEGRCVKVYE